MSKIYYEKHRGAYECSRIENDEERDIHIIFSEPEYGIILINGRIKTEVKDGYATLSSSFINDGAYRPKLIRKNELFDLEGFHVGTGVSKRLRSDEYIHSLLCELNEEKNLRKALEERILILENKINGQPII